MFTIFRPRTCAARLYTNSTPAGPYRGAGKPEAIYVMERLVDMAAAEMKIDRSSSAGAT